MKIRDEITDHPEDHLQRSKTKKRKSVLASFSWNDLWTTKSSVSKHPALPANYSAEHDMINDLKVFSWLYWSNI